MSAVSLCETEDVPSTSAVVRCIGCNLQFPNKNQLFRHLACRTKTCFSPEQYSLYMAQVASAKRYWQKIAVLYGYLPGTDYRFGYSGDAPCGIEGGHHAAWLVTHAIDRVSRKTSGENSAINSGTSSQWSAEVASLSKCNRSYGSTSRVTDATLQDRHTGAITEILCTTAMPLHFGEDIHENDVEKGSYLQEKVNLWVDSVNAELQNIMDEMECTRSISQEKYPNKNWSPGQIQVFGRLHIPNKKFNAESDIVQRRVDYCLPADLLFISKEGNSTKDLPMPQFAQQMLSIQGFFDLLHSFPPGSKFYPCDNFSKESQCKPSTISKDGITSVFRTISDDKALEFMSQMKKLMKRFTTKVEELPVNDSTVCLDKKRNESERNSRLQTKNKKNCESHSTDCRTDQVDNSVHRNICNSGSLYSDDIILPSSKIDEERDTVDNKTALKRVFRRKRYHNFSPNVLAHDYLAYRRVDRFYHRATIRLEDDITITKQSLCSGDSTKTIQNRPFLVFSLTGDIFLNEQVVRMIGLLIAICQGVIDYDIIDCIFDEEYTNLIPAPPAPHFGLLAGECSYITWEGRLKKILSARRCNQYRDGWNNEGVVRAVERWEKKMIEEVAKGWCWDGVAADGRLNSVGFWLKNVLLPWSKTTAVILEDYRRWKVLKGKTHSFGDTTADSFFPSINSLNMNVPAIYAKVLHYLRLVNGSGLWPSTTTKRQLVMVTSSISESKVKALSVVRSKLNSKNEARSSAYSFNEGEGGASGSFSLGIMPGEVCDQPRGNMQFPELLKAVFELELCLRPDREPSSTIAINRNAQFRPHVDNGAGAGQSTSLIVGLGNYVGGELMVEGLKKDIRYDPHEFDGWKQRHWTLPFKGERYSLVWFTPRGCEGMRGIDL